MTSYLQRLFDRAAGLAARPATALTPSFSSRSPIAEADQRLNLPDLGASLFALSPGFDAPSPGDDEALTGIEEPAARAMPRRAAPTEPDASGRKDRDASRQTAGPAPVARTRPAARTGAVAARGCRAATVARHAPRDRRGDRPCRGGAAARAHDAGDGGVGIAHRQADAAPPRATGFRITKAVTRCRSPTSRSSRAACAR